MKPAPALAGAAVAALLLASVIGLFTVGDGDDDGDVTAPTVPESTTSSFDFFDTTSSSIDISSTTQAVAPVDSTTTTSGGQTTTTSGRAPASTRPILAIESVNGVDQVVRVDPMNGASGTLTTSAATKADPAYNPVDTHFVYSDAGNIVFDNAKQGGEPQSIARSGGSTTFFDPMITEDIQRLVVEQRTSCTPQPCNPAVRVTLFTLANNQSQTVGKPGGFDPALSPDGTRVAMIEEGALVVYTITSGDVNGTRAVVAGGPGLSGPAWSPDGGRIAFTETNAGASRLVTVGSDGQARAVVSPDLAGSRPSWSPDGRSLVFVQGDDVLAKAPLSVVNPDGSGLRGIPGPARDAPAW